MHKGQRDHQGTLSPTLNKHESNSKNKLIDRLFDRPTRTDNSQRPRVFSTDPNRHKLTPTIVREHHRKAGGIEKLPSIQLNSTRKNFERLRTEQPSVYFEIEKVNQLKQNCLEERDRRPAAMSNLKSKQLIQRSRIVESRMNRTLTESRYVTTMMDRLKGIQLPTSTLEQTNLQGRKRYMPNSGAPQSSYQSQRLHNNERLYNNEQQLHNNEQQLHNNEQQLHNNERRQLTEQAKRRIVNESMQYLQARESVAQLESSKQIDLFIYMAEDGKIPSYEFYYMVKEESNDYYNMEIVTYQSVSKNRIKSYYTLSGHGVTRYEDSRPMQFQALADWDAERRQFNQLKQLQFFRKFRKWKTLKKWIRILSRQRMQRVTQLLSENLFLLKDQYRELLLTHFNVCFDLQQYKCIHLPAQPLSLEAFRSQQQAKKNSLIYNLKQCSKQLHLNSTSGLRRIVEDLRTSILSSDNFQEDKYDTDKPTDNKMEAFVELGFSRNITFDNRAMARGEFIRFIRLAFLLDFISVEALGNMVVANIEHLKTALYSGVSESLELPQGLSFGVTQNSQGKNVFQGNSLLYRPLFSLNVVYVQHKDLQFQQEKVSFQEVKNDFLRFDLEGFIIQGSEGFSYEEDTVLSRRFCPILSSKVLAVVPQRNHIADSLLELVTDTLDSIQIVDRWAKNEQFRPYLRALEEWDQILGDNWGRNDQRYLSNAGWLRESKQFRNFKAHVKRSVDNTYGAVIQFLQQHNDLLNSFERNRNSCFARLGQPSVQDQSVVFETVYAAFSACEQYMSKYLVDRADIYIYSVDFGQVKSSLCGNHAKMVSELCLIFGEIIRTRSGLLKAWLSKSIGELSGLVIRIDDFVVQKGNLERISAEITQKREEISILKQLLGILDSSAHSNILSKEQKDVIADLNSLSSSLFLTISDAENQLPKYIQRFRKEIKQSLEKFERELEDLKDLLAEDRFTKNVTDIEAAAKDINSLETRFSVLQEYSRKHHIYEQAVELTEFTSFKQLREAKTVHSFKQKIFNGIIDLDNYARAWNETKMMAIEVKTLATVCEKYMKDLLTVERTMPENLALPLFKKKLFVFRDSIPVITALRCPYLQPNDYTRMQALLQSSVSLQGNQQLTLRQFLQLPFQACQDQLISIATNATQYYHLKRQLEIFENQWAGKQLKLRQFRETSDIVVLCEAEELIGKLDEAMSIAGNLLSNRYIGPLRERAQRINNEILVGQQIVQKLIECQKKWVYLQNIFLAQDIKKQLMVEAGYFVVADKFLKGLTKKVIARPLIVRLIKSTSPAELTKILELLELIENKLQDYLQVKRKLFSRFYFISNDELVEILANSLNMAVLQKHINKLFEGVACLQNGKDTPTTVQVLMSPEGELLRLVNGISTRFNIEMWLNSLQKEMAETMKRVIRDGNKDYHNVVQKTRLQWVLNHRSQVVTTDNQIIWTSDTEEAIREAAVRRDSLTQWYDLLVKQLQQLTEFIRGDLSTLYHRIAVALITADVHNRDIAQSLMQNEVESIHEFQWQQQLRYYLQQSDTCVVRQVNATMDYGYEYLGATTRLVITPLTDRCWITITSGISHHLGAAPAGPAGTGKTESTKDLAKGLARICIVFNCSDQITTQMIGKLFAGLAQQGAWTCLDEFNRIDIEVLSVIAQQLFSIRVGLIKDKGEVELEGRMLPIRKNFGVFITMNPGYAGRTQLPDNLKSLFRPVSMMIPDYVMIAEIMLFAEGFGTASELSRKMIQLYKLASEQLSQQKHYDFGLRAVKSLLVMAGQLKRADQKCPEDTVLIRAMKDSNLPKFLASDILLFKALVSDLFPGVSMVQSSNEMLRRQVIAVMEFQHLGNCQSVSAKVVQLQEVINIRFGVMLMGEAGAGKTTCYRLLKEARTRLQQQNPEAGSKYSRVEEKVVNPKSVTMGQLYGEVDLLSMEWTDGVLSSIIRECNNSEPPSHYWVVLDGPVDSLWIENLNTVLDDNMTLCLANGERIKLRGELRMLFEVENLDAASPATVSRCGMVYIPPNNNHRCIVESAIADLPIEGDYQKYLLSLVSNTLQRLLSAKESWFQPIPTCRVQVAECFVLLLRVFLGRHRLGNSYEENTKRLNFVCAYCLIWAVGSAIEQVHYGELETLLRAQLQSIFLPKTETIFDFYLQPDTQVGFVSWESKLCDYEFQKGNSFHAIMVPTIDTLKYKHMLEILLEQRKPAILTGETGVGKTSLVVPLLFSKKEVGLSTIFLNFSAKTRPRETQLAIEAKLTKKAKTVFGARLNESIAVFIDDINMPEMETEGAQPTIELLRQYLDYHGFYDRQKLFWKQVIDTTLVACGATPQGGRNKLTSRFTRHAMLLCLPEPSEVNLKKIFGAILKGFLHTGGFPDTVKKLSDGLVAATLDFYRTIRKELLPIPSKFHYQFNLRDISRVFQGVLQCSSQVMGTVGQLQRLWVHEMQRVFFDRLVDESDRVWFMKNCVQIGRRYSQGLESDMVSRHKCFTYLLSADTGQPEYEACDELAKIGEYLQSKIYEYNAETSGKLELVFFQETIQHILNISRLLFQPRGNAMLIGIGGSGKQSLTKISAFVASCRLFQLDLGRNYGLETFRVDLQKLAMLSGVEEAKLCFLFVDTQILYEEFLESVNNLLNTGEVPNLFRKKDEIDDIISRVRSSAMKHKVDDTPESLWSFFVSRIRANLHVVLCMSPAGDALRVRARKFPSLVNCCTIDWFNCWSEEALVSVAQRKLSKLPLASEQQRRSLVSLCNLSNQWVSQLCQQYRETDRRRVQITPKTYLDQMDLFEEVLYAKQRQMDNSRRILTDGLEKLLSTNDVVLKLKMQMNKLQPKLQEQCVKTDEFLRQLAGDKEAADAAEQEVQVEAEDANEQMVEIKAIKEEAQNELGKALPMLLEAEDALKRINKNDITEIKGYANPHPVVQMVMEAVCTLLGEKTEWASIKVVMMEMNFLDRLRGYDKNNIPDLILKKLRGYITRPEFDPVTVGQKNLASKSLCMWCKAIDNYARVNKEVEPKKKKLAELQRVFDAKNRVLFVKQRELDKIKGKIAKLQKECEETLDLKNKLQANLDLTGKRLERAQKLISLLKDEGFRWSSLLEGFKVLMTDLPGEAFISSLFLSYLGPFTGEYRVRLLSRVTAEMKSCKVAFPSQFSLTTALYDQITVREWVLQGLPNDAVSIENAIIAKKGKRYPLMVDPQGQANKWLRNNLQHCQLSIINFSLGNYLKTIENAVTNGHPVLVEEVAEYLESSIDSLLQKKVLLVDGLNMVMIGERKVPYDNSFYLYFTTRLSNPKYLAEVFNKTTVINFSITFGGLRDQLLSQVCQREKPEIEQQRDEIIVTVAGNRKFLKESQDKTLRLLAQSQGMVLDDVQLIATLEQAKSKSREVEKILQLNSIVEQEINRARAIYLPVAVRGTLLYFVIDQLCLIEPMYEYSLDYVKKMYQCGLEQAEFNSILELKIKRLNESITKVMFTCVSRTLFEAHKKLYSFLLCAAIKQDSKAISHKEWLLFSTGPGLRPKFFKEVLQNPNPTRITSDQWYFMHLLSQIKDLEWLLTESKTHASDYLQFFEDVSVIGKALPGRDAALGNPFHYLLLSRLLSPHNLVYHVSEYVHKELGKYYDQSHVVSIEEVLSSSVYCVPLLFILSTGVDPTANILNYCLSKNLRLETISLGQGQGRKAEALIKRSQADGTWVLLNNCHLTKSWLGELDKLIGQFSASSIENKNFRLLLSSLPVSYFPSNILQNADKITLEPPRGVKPNLSRSFKQFSQETINACPTHRKEWLQCLYSLTFFHALLQERRKYGPLGFNIQYDFNDSDLDISVATLQNFLNDSREDINWEAIWYMVGHINYGGRVTDDLDRICLMSTLRKCLSPDLLGLSANEKYYYSDNEDYYCLNCHSLEDFQLAIERTLPAYDSPEVFGLHPNANISFLMRESARILQCVQLQDHKGEGARQNILEIISNLQQLPACIYSSKVHTQLQTEGETVLPSLTNFLLQQIDKFNNFLDVVTASLTMLERAMKGLLPMNSQLESVADSLVANTIPRPWRIYCYQTLKDLASWHADFKLRMGFLEGCLKDTPPAYWISCFFFPQGLLTAFLQIHARKNKIPIDTLSFKFKLTDIELEKLLAPKEGGYIHGLYFEGARWDSNRESLADEHPGKLNEPCPPILLLPVENYEQGEMHYNCPCYKTSRRSGVLSTTGQSTNFILGVHLTTKIEKRQYWTLKGAALLCQVEN